MTGVSITTTPNTSFASYYSPYNYSPYNYPSSLTSSDYTELETKSYYELKVGKIVRRGTKVTTYKFEKILKIFLLKQFIKTMTPDGYHVNYNGEWIR